jgi:hypothetical protein
MRHEVGSTNDEARAVLGKASTVMFKPAVILKRDNKRHAHGEVFYQIT